MPSLVVVLLSLNSTTPWVHKTSQSVAIRIAGAVAQMFKQPLLRVKERNPPKTA